MIRRLWTFLFAPEHRFVCRGCGKTWDRRFRLSDPGYWPMMPPPPGGDDRPFHGRPVTVEASDGLREVELDCGPVVYEGRRVRTRPSPWPVPPTEALLLAVLLVLAATAGAADVAWVSFDTCSGGNHYYNVTVGNVTRQTTGTCSVGSGTITSATGFVAGDIGKTLIVHGCGASARSLIGTITARSASSVTVNVNASTAATATTVLLMGATQVIPDDDSDEAVTFRLWLKRQLDRGKTRLQALGHIVIKDVP